MRLSILVLAIWLVCLTRCAPAAASAPTSGGSPSVPIDNGRFVEIESIAAAGLPDQRVTIWLPPEYNVGSKRRFPVIYMQDGHNLFFADRASYGKIWAADKAILSLVAQGKIEPHIIVGIWAPGADRYRQYLPRIIFDNIGGAIRASMDSSLTGDVVSDRYVEWLSDELKPDIDRNYRTKKTPKDTAIAGSSMGGLISCYAFVKRPEVFGRAACVSAHWPAGDPRQTAQASDELASLWTTFFAASLGKPERRKLWMDHGTATLDQFYAPYQIEIDKQFMANGWIKGKDFDSRVFEGAEHDENAWAARLPEILAWTLAK